MAVVVEAGEGVPDEVVPSEPLRSVNMRRGVIVEGGGLRRPWALPASDITEAEGIEFFFASKCDRLLQQFLGVEGDKTWGVLDAIKAGRQKATEEWCAKRLFEDDPMAKDLGTLQSPSKDEMKKLKQSMPVSILIRVTASGGCDAHAMRVLTAVSANERIAFEISQINFNWLYKAVQVGSYTEVYRNESQSQHKLGALATVYKNVRWRQGRKTLWTTFRQKGKTRTLSKRISSCSDEDRNANILAREAKKLQHQRDAMHETTPKKKAKKNKQASDSVGEGDADSQSNED